MDSNSPNPYSYHREGIGYTFETVHKIRYMMYFMDYSFMLSPALQHIPIYTFNLELYDFREKLPPTDPRIEHTVVKFLETFILTSKDSLIFIYDSIDGRAASRYQKFSRWYKKSGNPFIQKLDFQKTESDFELIVSVLYHIDNSDKELLLNEIERLIKNDMSPLN